MVLTGVVSPIPQNALATPRKNQTQSKGGKEMAEEVVAALATIGLVFGVSHLSEFVAAIVFLSVMVAIAIIALVNHAIQWHKRGEELKAWALMELSKDEAKDKKEHHFVEVELPDVVQL
jgi:protein-S-isoprenylcysteine O-methyltransferase Ste14